MRVDEAELGNLITRSIDRRMEEFAKMFEKRLDFINSEKFIDEIIERINKKQLG